MAYSLSVPVVTGVRSFRVTASGFTGGSGTYRISVTDKNDILIGYTSKYSVFSTSYTFTVEVQSNRVVEDVGYLYLQRYEGQESTQLLRKAVSMTNNPAPSSPSSITYSSSINSYSTTRISWSSVSGATSYVLERALNGSSSFSQVYSGSGTSYSDSLSSSTTKVQYRVKAVNSGGSSDYKTGSVSSVYYTKPNAAPTVPDSISVPTSVRGGQSLTVTWGISTDSNNNLSGYILERQYNGGSWTQLYKGSSRTYTDTITAGWTSVAYRVKAYDSAGANSGYRTSDTRTVINNTAPTISGSNSNLGTKTGAFNQAYTITDTDAGQTITAVEKIDGVQKRSYTATSGQSNTFSVTAAEWLKLLNGSHTLTITATDNLGGTATRTYTFTKNVTEIEMTLEKPLAADGAVTRAIMNITRTIPTGAAFTVEVCNNGNDTSPTWEDVTNAVISGSKFFLTNKTKTAANWGFNFRIKVNRGSTAGDCYIQGVGGNFE